MSKKVYVSKLVELGMYTKHFLSEDTVEKSTLSHKDRVEHCLSRGCGYLVEETHVVSRNGNIEYLTSEGFIAILDPQGRLNNLFAPFLWYAEKEFSYAKTLPQWKQVRTKIVANKDLATETNQGR